MMNPIYPLISIITPAYNEATNLPILYQRLCQVLDNMPLRWEWVVVDDHSTDSTLETVRQIAHQDNRLHGVRLSRNYGSHIAITCGLHMAQGDCVTIIAADLQDPPEILPKLFACWQDGVQVVCAVRARRNGEKISSLGFSRLYYLIMRNFVGLKEMPATGADFFLLDRKVVDAFCQFRESNTNILALITWMGFRQVMITYDKQPRLHGHSGWSFRKKLKLVVDSITSFSYLPIRLMSYMGFIIAVFGFFYAGLVIVNGLAGKPPEGWASLMVAILIIGGLQMLMMGVLGEYLWRALDETRRRPRYIIEATINLPSQPTDEKHG
jgi:glycosyltransferase involved in cell wall biosynthesis